MKVLSTEGLTKLIQLIKSSFISVDDTIETDSLDTVETETMDTVEPGTMDTVETESMDTIETGTMDAVETSTTTLATVATSGSYNDLLNKPTIPPAITVDSSLSTTSTNPVQNKVVTTELNNKVTLNTAQSISGRKTFLGEKAIYFKQKNSTDKLGFTLYNSANTELAALEYRPSTINGKALLALNSKGDAAYIGFRYWTNNVNYVLPQGLTQGNYYMPVTFANGTSIATASSLGVVDLSGLGFLTSSALSPYAKSADLAAVATSGSYNDLSNKPTIPTITDTYSATSSNGMSGKAVASAVSNKADKATSLSGYGITDAYTKTEADGKFSTGIVLRTWTTT